MHFSKEILQAMKASRAVSWEQRQSQYNLSVFHIINILLVAWEGLRMRLEYYIPLKKKGFILQSEDPNFENIRRGAKHSTAWPLHFKFASRAYVYA